jgi:hypothetical protein
MRQKTGSQNHSRNAIYRSTGFVARFDLFSGGVFDVFQQVLEGPTFECFHGFPPFSR